MKKIESYRQLLNKQQTELRQVMNSFEQHELTIQLFLRHHAMLHSAPVAQNGLGVSEPTYSVPWFFEDEVLHNMTAEQLRRIPPNCEHSVAWCLWHIARVEDVTMNLLVAGSSQILHSGNWLKPLKISDQDTANEMSDEAMATLSEAINLEALRAYRIAVGRRTQEIVLSLKPETLKQKVDPSRIQQVWAEEAVVKTASGIVDYWSKRNIAGLLLMPATRHNLVHLNEAFRLRQKRS